MTSYVKNDVSHSELSHSKFATSRIMCNMGKLDLSRMMSDMPSSKWIGMIGIRISLWPSTQAIPSGAMPLIYRYASDISPCLCTWSLHVFHSSDSLHVSHSSDRRS